MATGLRAASLEGFTMAVALVSVFRGHGPRIFSSLVTWDRG